MEDLNSWLRSAHFSKKVHHISERDSLQIPIISSDVRLTGNYIQVGSKMSKTGTAAKRKVVSEMFKRVKEAVRRRFLATPSRETTGDKTVKSSLRPKKKSRWMKMYFNRDVSQVGVLDISSETDWKPDLYELIRWKKMASKVRCPIHRANQESKEAD